MSLAELSLKDILAKLPLDVQTSITGSLTEQVYVWVLDNETASNTLISFLQENGFYNILKTEKNGLYTITAQIGFQTIPDENANPDTAYKCPNPTTNCPNFSSPSTIDTLCFVKDKCNNCANGTYCYILSTTASPISGDYQPISYCATVPCGNPIPTSCFTDNGDRTYTLNYDKKKCNPFN